MDTPDAAAIDGGSSDGGAADGGGPDGGSDGGNLDGGVDGGVDAGPGPWPLDPIRSLGAAEGLPNGAWRAAVDDAQNLWVIDGSAVYVIRPGENSFHVSTQVGQLSLGEADYALCGGAPNQAYVGYLTQDSLDPANETPAQRAEGDLDRLVLQPDGSITLDHHYEIHNTNDFHFDETRSVLTCLRVPSGPDRGELYIGTNHAVTRIRGDEYADHRHVVFDNPPGSGRLVIGYTFAVSFDPSGNLFFANVFKFGLIAPTPVLRDWLDFSKNPYLMDSYVDVLGAQIDPDDWHAAAVTKDGHYWLGSWGKGLVTFTARPRNYRFIPLPDNVITALEAEADGSLWVATGSHGLYRLEPATGIANQLAGIPSDAVRGLFYDGSVNPRALYISTAAGITVYRGP